MTATFQAEDGKHRCFWCSATPDYIDYHDKEWGYPVDDDVRLFEKLTLESFQSGLSWRTILMKRENFRKAFKQFDFKKIAKFTEQDVDRLLQDEGIVRHRGKIEATINNARQACVMIKEEGTLAAFFWQFEPEAKNQHEPQTVSTTEESVRLSKTLKKRDWKFVGPTTVYAFMQAAGLVNDHAEGCVYRQAVIRAKKTFKRPLPIR